MEVQMLRAARARVVGELAAGVVHDLKNVLAVASGRLQLMGRHQANSEVREGIGHVLKSVSAATQLVSRLHDCARGRWDGNSETAEVRAVVEESLHLIKHRLGTDSHGAPARIVAAVAIDKGLEVALPHGELVEVVLNLIINACDAMPQGGTLTVRGSRDATCPNALLEVADTGVGMSKEVESRVFEPFFTTKGEHGTGLGLAVVRSVMVRRGGTIAVESQPGRGTRFLLSLPLP
jgi:signal transduction histidine kinase